MKLLGTFLGVLERPEDHLIPEEDRVEGSCEWLIDKSSFNQWMEENHRSPKFFWLSGNPAAGKSVLSTYVVRYLEKSNKDCSYFFFRHNDKSRSSVSAMLRSVAYQMALTNGKVREALLTLREEGELKINQADERTIWRKIFMALIFKTNFTQPHFWIIDGLDECHNYAAIVPMLAKINEKFPLRVFLSSRTSSDLDKLFHSITQSTTLEHMSLHQTQADIRLYIEANIQSLPVEGDLARKELTEKILEKSNDCFLWAHLVLRELEQAYTPQQIMDVLDEVPKQMDPLYTRILEGMSKNTRNIELIKALLTWTACATHPLELDELKEALKLDIERTIPRLDKLIESSCGEMVYVDKQSKVQLIHQTAREFLLGTSIDSEFAISRGAGHAQLAVACLRYLVGEEMSTPRHRRKSSAARIPKKSCFADYASTAFSEHVKRASPSVDLPLTLLDNFLKTNVLTWIEYLATSKNLYHLVLTARNLKAYLQRRAEQRSPLGTEFQNADSWATDLIRVAMAFGNNLVECPFAIHFLIPPICPSQSRVYKQFASNARSLEVIGVSATEWDDRLSCITYRDDYCSAIACRDNRLAVGLSSGAVILYNAFTCREVLQLEHGERVQCLEIGNIKTLLASSGRRQLSLWNTITGHQLWALNVSSALLTLCFYEDDMALLAATKANHIASWWVNDGTPRAACPWHDTARAQSTSRSMTVHQRAPTVGQFSVELNILAIAYRSKPLVLWDMEENSLIGTFDRRASPHSETTGTSPQYGASVPSAAAVALVFNPDPNIRLLAIAYQDGDLAVIDPIDQEVKAPIIIADASVLAASPDGKTLATGDAAGTIKLFNFGTLEPLYRIACIGYDIKALAFSTDGLRFFDIRGPQCNVWEPVVLVRKYTDDSTEDSQDGAPLGPVQTIESHDWSEKISITAVVAHHTGDFLFCAKEDGSVWAYKTDTGDMMQELYHHAEHVAVFSLVWNEKESLLASADLSSRFIVRKVLLNPSDRWRIEEPLIDRRSDHSIHQILLSPDGDCLLLSTSVSDSLWDLRGTRIGIYTPTDRESWSWITHPKNPDHLILFRRSDAHVFDWKSLKELTTTNCISLRTDYSPDVILKSVMTTNWPTVYRWPSMFILEHVKADRVSTTRYLSLWNSDQIQPTSTEVQSHARYSRMAAEMMSVIGVHGSSLIFLNHRRWFCTLDLDNPGDDVYVRHFFMPPEWYSSGRQLVCHITAKGHVVFVQEEDITVIKNGLYYQDLVNLDQK
jgi:WD40 repeat protein